MRVYMYKYVCISGIHVLLSTFIHMYVYTYTHVYMYVYVCIHVYIYIHIYVCVCICSTCPKPPSDHFRQPYFQLTLPPTLPPAVLLGIPSFQFTTAPSVASSSHCL